MRRGRLPLILIPLAALIPILPLLVHGCSCGHDFNFHILNWLEGARGFTHGDLHPQWANSPGWTAGEPRFVFYPPISWTVGGILGLLLPWAWAPIAYTWLVLTAAGFALHRLAGSFASPTAALLAAVFYLTNPYTLFTAYERTAYAELLAAIWLPLLLHAILRPEREGGVTVLRIAAPLALLWLSNAPAAVIGCYGLALLAVIRLLLERKDRLRMALRTVSGTLLGLGLAAFYLVPAAWERRYVQIQMAILPGLRIQDNFLFHHTTAGITDPAALADAVAHDKVLYTASLIALMLLALTAIAMLFVRREPSIRGANLSQPQREPGSPAYSIGGWSGYGLGAKLPESVVPALVTLTLILALLLLPLSAPIWHYAPELAFLQFPWRVLALLAAVSGLSTALALRSLSLKPAATSAIALATALALTLPAYRNFRQACDPEDTVAGRRAVFHSNDGSEPTDEYTPVTADNDSLSKTDPPYWLATDPEEKAPSGPPGPAPRDLTLDSPVAQTLVLNLRNYPAWRVTRNGSPIIERQPREDGLIAFPIPAGPSQITVRYVQLPDQKIGLVLTGFSLAALALLVRPQRNKLRPNH